MSGRPDKKASSFRRLSHVILAVLIIFVAGAGANSDTRIAQAQSPRPRQEKIGAEVIEALRTRGEAMIVIALVEPQTTRLRQSNLAQLQREVAVLQDDVLSTLTLTDFRPTHKYRAIPALSGKLLTESGLIKLAQHPNVARIDLDVGGRGGLANSVPLIGANTWHAKGVTGDGVVVAVLDSGLDTDHSDLSTALIHQECFLDNDGLINGQGLCPNGSDRQSGAGAAEDNAGHGTHVTGIIASRGNQSSVGVAPGSSIVSIKVTAGPSFSGVFYFFSEIVAALDFIINNRPDVQIINMSLGTSAMFPGDCDNSTSFNMAGAAAINTLRTQGVIAFASSGNSASGTQMTSPACLSNVISVGATNNSNTVASFTNSNASTDLMAPGVNTVSAYLSNGTITASGTSMAAPHAAGCAALLIQSGEAATPDQIETRLETSPIQVTDPTNGLVFPRIDCSLKPLTEVAVSGPATGMVNTTYLLTAASSPITATQMITYIWQATGQTPITHTGGLSDTVSFSWNMAGNQIITATAANAGNSVTDTHAITIYQTLYLPVVVK